MISNKSKINRIGESTMWTQKDSYWGEDPCVSIFLSYLTTGLYLTEGPTIRMYET